LNINRLSGALEDVEPAPRGLRVGGDLGDVHRRPDAGQRRLQPRPAHRVGLVEQQLVVEGEQVEGDEVGRGGLGQQLDPRRGRVDPLGEQLEVEPGLAVGPVPADHDQLAVDRAPRRQLSARLLHHLGEVAGHRLAAPACQLDLVPVPEDDAPEAVPLGLVGHALGGGQPGHALGQHRLDRRVDRQVHGDSQPDRTDSREPDHRRWPRGVSPSVPLVTAGRIT
jgi:hypothetical protein